MKNTRYFLLSVRLTISICLIGIVASFAAAQSRRTQPVKSSTSSNRIEGQKEANKFWSRYVASCGGSRYIKESVGIFVELRGFAVQLDYEGITEADKLNGIEAKGVSRFTASSRRTFSNGAWHEWRNGTPADMSLINAVRFQKKSGQWHFFGTGYFNDYAKPVVCTDLPGRQTARQIETPTNLIRIDDTHVFPVREFVFWDSNTNLSGSRFPKSTTTFINWKITYQQMSFDYRLSGIEQYWYDKDGKQIAYIDKANFSNTGNGQLWWGRGWEQPGEWEVGAYTVKIYQRKQLIARKTFEIVSDEALPKALRYDGLYYKKYDDGSYWFLRFFENGTVRDIIGRYKSEFTSGETSLQSNVEHAWTCTENSMLERGNIDDNCKDFHAGEGQYVVRGARVYFTDQSSYHRDGYEIIFGGAITGTLLNLVWDAGSKGKGTDSFVYTKCPYRDCN